MPRLKFVFAGFRHPHIFGLLDKVRSHPGCEIAAIGEEDAAAARQLAEERGLTVTHTDLAAMFAGVDCDVAAIGDCYGRRGAIAIAALESGCHVIADKPLCTRLSELDRIVALSAARDLKIGCMLDLRDNGNCRAARRLIHSGELGEVTAIQLGGQHPLLYGKRAGWYFDPELHGGTLNDIAIHAVDLLGWLTGEAVAKLDFARTWNAGAPENFPAGGQFALRLANGAGVLGDVSYFAPDSCGYTLPYYWRFTVWGTRGVVEFNYAAPGLRVALNGDAAVRTLPPAETGTDYFESFLADLTGGKPELDTATVLRAARLSLELQQLAETKE